MRAFCMRGVNSSGSTPSHGKQTTLTDITRTMARQWTEGTVRVAIARSTIATHAACWIMRTSSSQVYGMVVRRSGQFACESRIKLPWTRRADGTPLTTPLVWHMNARPPTPPRTGPPRDRNDREMIVENGEDATIIAETIVEAAAAMGVSILAQKIKVCLVE